MALIKEASKIIFCTNGDCALLRDSNLYIKGTEKEGIIYISEKGFDAEFGARPVKRVIQRDVLNPLSKEILSAKISTDSIILLDAFDGQLVFRNQ